MTTAETLTTIVQQNKTLISQNEMLISLTARLVWPPEKLVEMIIANKKRDPEAYISVYNALDGEKTGKQLGEIVGVSQQAISFVLQGWVEDGIVMTVGTESQPRYRRLMKLPEKRKVKAKVRQETKQVTPGEEAQIAEPTGANNGN